MNRREFGKGVPALLLLSVPRVLIAEQLLVLKVYTYKVAGGCVLKADVHGAGVRAKKPVIFCIHGVL